VCADGGLPMQFTHGPSSIYALMHGGNRLVVIL